MKIIINREALLESLQKIIGVVERRQTMPILGYVLFRQTNNTYELVASDMEVQLVSPVEPESVESFEPNATFPGRKIYDICKGLPSNTKITINYDQSGKSVVSANKSKFTLASLDGGTFPIIDPEESDCNFQVNNKSINEVIEKVAFAMAQQDVRFYLNGMFFNIADNEICGVATDGHRLAKASNATPTNVDDNRNAIIPRKGVMEMQKHTDSSEEETISGKLSANYLTLSSNHIEMTTKLIEGKFPSYEKVIPSDCDKTVKISVKDLKESLSRVSILSNDRFRGVRLLFESNTVKISAHNPEKEEAQEELDCLYDGPSIEVGFNVAYLLDVLNVVRTEMAEINLKDSNSSALLTPENDQNSSYVIMPMRL